MTKNIKSQNGFSLIELMVVVGIIGILAAIAVPQFSKFQAKARQSEAKGNLAALYSAEKAFFSEWTGYTADVRNAGFGIEGGALRYDVGFPNTAVPVAGYPVGAPAENAANRRASASLGVGSAFKFGAPPTIPAAGTETCTNLVFVAQAWGDPNSVQGAGGPDIWRINQVKVLSQAANGIN